MIRVGIVGATGYTALELLRILFRHPEVQITQLTSRDESRPRLDEVHPSLQGRSELRFSQLDIKSFIDNVDFAFCCLPHAASAAVVRQLLQHDIKVVDFSADYRLNDVATFETWYQVEHPDPDRVGTVPYGIPELFRDQIRDARLVANPGCFPSSAILPLAPLLQSNLIQPSPIIVDSKTGISGAGRKPHLKFHFPECNESVTAYSVGTHRHMPEIDQILQRRTHTEVVTHFTPHLIPMDRGILSTIYVNNQTGVTIDAIQSTLDTFYSDEPFVRVNQRVPSTKDVAHSNYCDISVSECRGLTVIVSALDNLIKGASGAAVQNFNLMSGFPETLGLL